MKYIIDVLDQRGGRQSKCSKTNYYKNSLVTDLYKPVAQYPFTMMACKLYVVMIHLIEQNRGRLDLAVIFTPFIPDRQNTNQVQRNICAGALQRTPSS